MINCRDKESNLCVETLDPKCMSFQGEKGDSTKITLDCVDQHMVNEDIYSILQDTPKRVVSQTYALMQLDEKNTNKSYLVVNDEDKSLTNTRYEYWKEGDKLIYITSTLE